MSDTGDLSRTEYARPMTCTTEMASRIRELIGTHARLAMPLGAIADEGDLFAAGLTSLATVNLMLAVEEAFDIEIPDAMLTRGSFSSITALARVVAHLVEQRDAE